ncbi:MotA/TolQ/ExbB proton channel family protein [Prolixibacteraceae bacterium JC049]|nr:MotA/TolQ/ExbB proton channel family protein [Prolixibacteraceae bacterium JC049]
MDEITKVLYWISTGLLVPTIVLLLVFFLRALMLIGTFYGMYIQKIKFNKGFNQVVNQLTKDNVQQLLANEQFSNKLLVVHFLKKIRGIKKSDIHYEKALSDFEIACQKDLSGSQTLARLGPVLGLMGTLIPMGPALVGLAAGDIESMAANMQVAFATTVIGLLTGAVGFVVLQVKKRWFAADISNLEFITELLKQANDVPVEKMNE